MNGQEARKLIVKDRVRHTKSGAVGSVKCITAPKVVKEGSHHAKRNVTRFVSTISIEWGGRLVSHHDPDFMDDFEKVQ